MLRLDGDHPDICSAGSLPRSTKPAAEIRSRQPAASQTPAAPVARLPTTARDAPVSASQPTATPTSPLRGGGHQSRCDAKSPRRGKLFASLERNVPRVFDMITPRRLKRDNSVVKICKVGVQMATQ